MREESHSIYAQWATFVAVVIGLLLVIYELRQSANVANMTLYASTVDSGNQKHLASMGDDPRSALYKSAMCPDQLTGEELVTLDAYYRVTISGLSRERQISNTLNVERSHDIAVPNIISMNFSTEPGRLWLEAYLAKPNPLSTTPETLELVQKTLKNMPERLGSSAAYTTLSRGNPPSCMPAP